MALDLEIKAIQETISSGVNTTVNQTADITLTLPIETLVTGRFQLKFSAKGTGKISKIAAGIIESKDNFVLTLSSYSINSVNWREVVSFYLQKFSINCDTMKFVLTVEV